MKRWLFSFWTGLLGAASRHRAVVMALLSTVVAPGAITVAVQPGQYRVASAVLFLITLFVIVLTGLLPSRYAAEPLLGYMLPTIHKVLALKDSERIAIHHLKSARRQQYEQLTEYWLRPKTPARGRTFTFSPDPTKNQAARTKAFSIRL